MTFVWINSYTFRFVPLLGLCILKENHLKEKFKNSTKKKLSIEAQFSASCLVLGKIFCKGESCLGTFQIETYVHKY